MPGYLNSRNEIESRRERRRRGNTKGAKNESYRLDAINYVQGRDAKIDEIVSDIMRKYPRMIEADARRIVVEHWATLERANDMHNTVRSLDFGYDERAMLDRLNGRLKDKLNDRFRDYLPDRLASRLPDTLSTAASVDSGADTDGTIERAARAISAATGKSEDYVRSMIRQVAQADGEGTPWPFR